MLEEKSRMVDYQWKLPIIERNFLPSNWLDLIPEAQEQSLQEAEDLREELAVSDKLQLLASLERLQEYTEDYLQPKLRQILNSQLSLDRGTIIEFRTQSSTALLESA